MLSCDLIMLCCCVGVFCQLPTEHDHVTDIQSKLSVRNFRGCLAANHAVWCGIFDLPGENQKEGGILRIFGKGRESWEIMDVADRSQPRQAVVKDVLGERVQKMFQDFLEEYVGYLGSYIIASCGRERDFWGVSLSLTHSPLSPLNIVNQSSPPLSPFTLPPCMCSFRSILL